MKINRFRPAFLVVALCAFAGSALGQGPMNRSDNRFGDTTSNQGAQTREARIRSTLSAAGYTDPDLQQQVLSLARQEQAASQSLLPKINALRSALTPARTTTNGLTTNGFNTGSGFNGQTNGFNNTNASNANTINTTSVARLFADYRSAVAEMQTARADAIDQLDKSISFSTDPVLEALLTMMGVIGDETGFVSNMAGQAQLPGSSTTGGATNRGNNGGFGGMNGNMGSASGGMNTNGMGSGGMGGFGGNGGMMPPPPPNGN